MKYYILMGSPRKDGNTNSLLEIICKEIAKTESEINVVWLYDKDIKPCKACRVCQEELSSYGCPIKDDMQDIFDCILEADVILLATPIYAWYCTAPMKLMLDRLAYGMNKYFGSVLGDPLWAGKKCGIITTCGYRIEKGADLFEAGIKRLCRHSCIDYVGMLAVRDNGYHVQFMTEEKIRQAKEYANQLIQSCNEL